MWKLALVTLLVTPSLAEACPEINGNYRRSLSDSNSAFLSVRSEKAIDKMFYRIGESEFIEANGVERRVATNGQSGTIRITCESARTVAMDMKVDNGPKAVIRITQVSETEIEVAVEGDDSGMAGRYRKE